MWDKMRLTFILFLLLLFIYRRHTTNTWTASSRRLHSPKWGNDETMKNDQSATGSSDASKTNNNNRNAPLVESLSAMASNLLMNDNSVEVSSERDVFVNDHKNNNNNDVSPEEESPEGNSSEESSADGNATSSPEDFKDDEDEDDDELLVEDNPRQKSDAVTTPQGLTTWSELQNLPSDSTVSSTSLLFADKEKQQQQQQQHEASSPLRTTLFANPFITTEIPRTTKSAVAKTKPTTGVKRKPYNKNKKVVLPNRFVKPALEEVTAEAVGTDATHTIYKVTSTSNQNSKQESKEGPGTNNNNPYGTTKRPFPIWPYQTTTRRALPIAPKRPPFYKPTKAKTPMGVKRPSSPSSSSFTSASTSVTTTPTPTTTVYNRIPSPVMYPFGPISFTNLGFMDFLRSQILPRIGLSLISFMAASPLILSMLGANALGRRRRRRRSVSLERRNTSPVSAQNIPYDFAALEKKFKSIQNESKNEWPLLTKAFDFLIHKFTSSLTSQFQKKNSS